MDRVKKAAAACVVIMMLCGCGGGGSDHASRRGAVRITILWPKVTRVIPAETRSIKLSAQVLRPDDGQVVGELIVPRPEGLASSTAVLEDLPSVKVRITATAHASLDGSGAALASGSKEVDVPENGSIPADINLTASSSSPGPSPSPAPSPGAPPAYFSAGFAGNITLSLSTGTATIPGVLSFARDVRPGRFDMIIVTADPRFPGTRLLVEASPGPSSFHVVSPDDEAPFGEGIVSVNADRSGTIDFHEFGGGRFVGSCPPGSL